jgi:hypothetical protein
MLGIKMGRSAKKKASFDNRMFDFQNEESHEMIESEAIANISHHVIENYSKFLHLDFNEKSLIWTASLSSNSDTLNLERYDYLTRFLKLVEDNKAELETALAKKKHFNFKDRRVSLKNKSSEILVKNMLSEQPLISTLSLMPDTFFSNLFASAFLSQEPAFNLIFTLLNDRIYQVFNESSARIYKLFERVEKELENPEEMKARIEANNRLDYNYFVETLFKVSSVILPQIFNFYKELPGINKLNSADFTQITETKFSDFYFIVYSILFIDGENYNYVTDDVIYSRFWMSTIRSKEIVDEVFEFVDIFNPLKLSKREKALLVTCIFTQPGIVFFLRNINSQN